MHRCGFTLIELLIVMAILGVTMVIILISSGTVSATQVAMASKDTLRLMRYARNMALQTQQPITLTFAPGVITLESPFDKTLRLDTASDKESEDVAKTPTKTLSSEEKAKGSTLNAGDIEAVGLTKYYEGVGFAFVEYNDSIKMGRSATRDQTDFHRRVAGEASADVGETRRQQQTTFSVTVRANGTTRPFSIRVYNADAAEDKCNLISFDFLCSGTIGNEND